MLDVPDTLVVLPTYCERENLERMIVMLLELPLELGVIVVDDNSPDGTGRIADELAGKNAGRVLVLHRAGKLGLGTAYRAGFDRALTTTAARIMTMDADFSHHPRYIPSMVQANIGGYDLVIGSRYTPGGGAPDFPLQRRFLSGGANAFARFTLGLRAKDVTAGFRCYRREVLESIPLNAIFSSGYSFLIEMLFMVQRAGFSIGEVPIIFEDRKAGSSKISRQEIFKALYTVCRLSARRVLERVARLSRSPAA